MAFFGATISIS